MHLVGLAKSPSFSVRKEILQSYLENQQSLLLARDAVPDVTQFSFWKPETVDVEVSLCNKLSCDFPLPLFRHFNTGEQPRAM